MFRLIHYTSCTVGIDEAERYHNPKDTGMQHIRQLLNSGYKQGMPAIRLIGEDMKSQAFDVYSPKILAATAGLEDILASRCIAIPTRRTDKRMSSFPPDFDGASIRHQMYTLALTAFPHLYKNFFERPALHTLHNRSGEYVVTARRAGGILRGTGADKRTSLSHRYCGRDRRADQPGQGVERT